MPNKIQEWWKNIVEYFKPRHRRILWIAGIAQGIDFIIGARMPEYGSIVGVVFPLSLAMIFGELEKFENEIRADEQDRMRYPDKYKEPPWKPEL